MLYTVWHRNNFSAKPCKIDIDLMLQEHGFSFSVSFQDLNIIMFVLTLISYSKGNKKCSIQYTTEITLAPSPVKCILIYIYNLR